MLPFWDPDHLALRARVRKWVGENLLPNRSHSSSLEERAIELTKALGAQGFLKYTVPADFGGIRPAVAARDLCILREELARGDALADTMFAMQALGSYRGQSRAETSSVTVNCRRQLHCGICNYGRSSGIRRGVA